MVKKVVVVGAGGHARVVVRLVMLTTGFEIVGVADRTRDQFGQQIGSAQINTTLNDIDAWRLSGVTSLALALGSNPEREQIARRADDYGLDCVTLVHPSAIVDESVTLADGAVVCAGAIITPDARIGRGVIVNTGSTIDHETEVGDFAQIAPGVHIAGRVKIGGRAMIGLGASILPNVAIGRDAVVGAGAVVTRNVPDGTTVVGCPARAK